MAVSAAIRGYQAYRAYTAIRAAAAARTVAAGNRMVASRAGQQLFARSTGVLNRNSAVRVGVGWSKPKNSEVFRVSLFTDKGQTALQRLLPAKRHWDLFKVPDRRRTIRRR